MTNVCNKALALEPQNSAAARAFFEQNFQPVRIARLGEGEGLVTGYYEPVVAGSRFPSPEFSVPIYRRPRDLVADGYKQGSTAFPNKGGRIGRRTENNDLVPYHDRGAIEAGALDGQKLEICWIKDPLDLVAIQIEGSARVILEDGTPLRISYDLHNGYSYSSIERVLAERNLIPRKELSKERIRAWTAAHPEEAAKARATNRAYMFFRVTGLTNDGEPVGAQGVPLTPGRSIAVDRVHEYGTPFFIEGNFPIEDAKPAAPVGRLTIAQDTGSAIVGPARADLYLGAGDDAGRIAGRIKHRGRFSMLVPRELDLAAAASELPLPVPKPKIAESEGDNPDDKGKAEPVRSGTVADGRHAPSPMPKTVPSPMPSPISKTKIAALDTEKADGKGRAESAGARANTDAKHPPQPPPRRFPRRRPRSPRAKPVSRTERARPTPTTRPGPSPASRSRCCRRRRARSARPKAGNRTAGARRRPPNQARPSSLCRHRDRRRRSSRPKAGKKPASTRARAGPSPPEPRIGQGIDQGRSDHGPSIRRRRRPRCPRPKTRSKTARKRSPPTARMGKRRQSRAGKPPPHARASAR